MNELVIELFLNQSHCLSGNTFASTRKPEFFRGGCFHGNGIKVYLQVLCDIFTHLFYVWQHFGSLSNDGDINICDTVAFLGNFLFHIAEENA